MAPFFTHVRLPFQTNMRDSVLRVGIDKRKLQHLPYDASLFDVRVDEFLAGFKLMLSHKEVFFTPPHHILPIHVDGGTLSNLCKLNWVYGGAGSKMLWWKPKPGMEMLAGVTPIGTPYLFADQRNCVMVKSASIGQPTLVNVGVPHSVLNSGAEERWCLSTVVADLDTGVNMEFADVVQRLKGFVGV
jgi:hypothetical protein